MFGGTVSYHAAGSVKAVDYAGLRPAPMSSLRAPALDPELIGAAVARHMPPMVSVHSGKDARQAADDAINDWMWRRDG
jgi:hypothetical protein